MRAFIALELPSPLRHALGMLGRRLAAERVVRWVPKKNLHLTLKFLGEVEEGRLDEITGLLGRAVAGIAAFEVELVGIGLLPPRRRPRIVYIPAAGPPELTKLGEAVDPAFEAIGVSADGRSFLPHVTVGRVRPRGPVTSLKADLSRFSDSLWGSALIAEAVVYQSILGPGGADYVVRARVPLC